MISLTALSCRFSWVSLNICSNVFSGTETSVRGYARRPKPPCTNAPNPPCRRAYDDLPPPVDPNCLNPVVKTRPKEKKGIMHYIKLKIVQGGSNFGTPFRRLDCKPCKEGKKEEAKAVLVKPKEPKELKYFPYTGKRAGLQVSVLGADTTVGHYVSLLLKQCPYMKKLRLYETQGAGCPRNLNIVVEDLKNINTNCLVQAFSNVNNELETCLQNSDIVLMLDTAFVSPDMPFETRFATQAPIVQAYAEAICTECPNAFVIVCTSPIDCMVPIVAETLKSTGMYNPAKVLGSLAVPEMRASTLAARALGLEPRYVKVPCIGGTEGETLVPLFSRAVDYFEFCEKSAETMTKCVRTADTEIMKCDCGFRRMAVLSEAHALTNLVTKVSHALLCLDMPRVTGFVETNASQLVTPAKFIANVVELSSTGIIRSLGLQKLVDYETKRMNTALEQLRRRNDLTENWWLKFSKGPSYLATEVFLNGTGVFHRLDFPPHMNETEMYLMESCLANLVQNVTMGNNWFEQTRAVRNARFQPGRLGSSVFRGKSENLEDCRQHLY